MGGPPRTVEASVSPKARARLPLRRKLLYAAAAVVLCLLALEGIAMVLVANLAPGGRTLPVPAPQAEGKERLKALIDKDREAERRRAETHIPMVADRERGWSLPARTRIDAAGVALNINSLGLRGAELTAPSPGEVRIFTLGDSSIMGQGVDEVHVFSSLAARLLAQGWKRKVVGVIGATPGYTSTQSLQTLRRFGRRVGPAWVVVGTIWSDVYRRDRMYPMTASGHAPAAAPRWRPALLRLLARVAAPLLPSRLVRFMDSRDDIGGAAAPTRVPLARYVQNLEQMAALAKKLGARVVFLCLPAPLDFDQVPAPDTVRRYRGAMRRVAKDSGGLFLDGPALFRQKGARPASHFFDQVHPDFKGHLLLGAELARLIHDVGPPPAGKNRYGAGK